MTIEERIKSLEEEVEMLKRVQALEQEVAELRKQLHAAPVWPVVQQVWIQPLPYNPFPVYPQPIIWPSPHIIWGTPIVTTTTGTLTITDGNISTSNTVYMNTDDDGTAMGGVVQNPSPFAPMDGSVITPDGVSIYTSSSGALSFIGQ